MPESGKLKYVRVCIDIFFHATWATAQTGETGRHVQRHLQSVFMVLGIPGLIKTDNGPRYVSKAAQTVLALLGVAHTTGIPHSPTGQSLVEQAHSVKRAAT